MREVSFIADVAVLPRWIRVSDLIDYVTGVHPRFDRAKAERFLAKTTFKRASKVRQMAEGMVAQLQLALVMGIGTKPRVLVATTVDRERLVTLGEVRRPSIADVFVAVMSRPKAEVGRQQSDVRSGSETQEGSNR